jgi:predicted transcriptional regulator/KaiC/GvpD/RAD55 family RecA-like ATPase
MIEVIAKKGICSLTRISYGVNMPVDRAKKTLQMLVSHGFVGEISKGDRTEYRATKRGLEYLDTFKKMQKFFAALESPSSTIASEMVLPGRMNTGYDELDKLLFGGIPEGYSVVLTSPSCDEKDALIKRFLETGAKEKSVTFNVTLDAGGVKNLAHGFPSNFYLFVCNPEADAIIESGPNVFKLKGVENLTDLNIALASAFHKIETTSDKSRRACIEIVSDVLLQHHALNTRRWLAGLIPELKSNNFTTIAVMNPRMHSSEEVQAVVSLFDGEVEIFEKETGVEGVLRFLRVRKMYNQRYQENAIPMKKRFA